MNQYEEVLRSLTAPGGGGDDDDMWVCITIYPPMQKRKNGWQWSIYHMTRYTSSLSAMPDTFSCSCKCRQGQTSPSHLSDASQIQRPREPSKAPQLASRLTMLSAQKWSSQNCFSLGATRSSRIAISMFSMSHRPIRHTLHRNQRQARRSAQSSPSRLIRRIMAYKARVRASLVPDIALLDAALVRLVDGFDGCSHGA